VARRAFLHVGTPKSGTSYLQSLWWRHRSALARRGLLLPGERPRDHFLAASLVCGRSEVVERLSPVERETWDRLVAEARAWQGDVLISHELFSPASVEQATAALDRLGSAADEVHVVVTARDLARQLRSDWQQSIKQGGTQTLEEFWHVVRDNPGDGWWLYQDLPSLLERWTPGVPPERTHLVVLPPEGEQSKDWLWWHVCALLRVDPAGLDAVTDTFNESLGIVEVEMLRRVQASLPDSERELDMRRLTRDYLASRVLARGRTAEPFTLPHPIQQWAVERGSAMLADLEGRGYDIVGPLSALRPASAPGPGRTPLEVTDTEVAERAVEAIGQLLLRERARRRRRRSREA